MLVRVFRTWNIVIIVLEYISNSISVSSQVEIGAFGDTLFSTTGTLLIVVGFLMLVDLIRETEAPVLIKNFKILSSELECFDKKCT